MILVVALIATLVLAATVRKLAATPEHPVSERQRAGRIAGVLLPFLAVLAVVADTFAFLSLPLVRASLGTMTIEQLRKLEADIPCWATQAAGLVPPWFAMAGVAAASIIVAVVLPQATTNQRVLLTAGQRAIDLMRRYATASSLAATTLLAASAFTLFGDGLEDRKGDVRREIHAAQLRFTKMQDELARQLGQQAAIELEREMADTRDDTSAAYYQARDLYAKRLKDAIEQLYTAPRERWISTRQLGNALIELSQIEWPSRQTTSSTGEMPQAPDGKGAEWTPHFDVERFPRNASVWRPAGPPMAAPAVSEASRDLIKEFAAGVLDHLKTAVASNPATAFFFEAFAAAFGELVAEAANRSVLEPALQRIWRAAARGGDKTALEVEAKLMVAAVDTAAHWERFTARFGDETRQASSLMQKRLGTLDPARFSKGLPTRLGGLDASDRMRLIETLIKKKLETVGAVLWALHQAEQDDKMDAAVARDARIADFKAIHVLGEFIAAGPAEHPSGFEDRFLKSLKGHMTSAIGREYEPKTWAERYVEMQDRLSGKRPGHPTISPEKRPPAVLKVR